MQAKQYFDLLTKEYSIVLATTIEELAAVREIRKEVFSSKLLLDKESLEDKGFVYNEEDEQSFIYLLKHNETDTYVGTVRVIFITEDTPIQKLYIQEKGVANNIEHLTEILPISEISRLALSYTLIDYQHTSALRLRTYLAIGLMIATRINFFLYPYERVFAFMEKSLFRILKRQGVNFEKISDTVELYGFRTPFAVERRKLLKETEFSMGEITRYYLKQMCQDPEKLWQFVDNNAYLDRSDIQLERICKLLKEYGDDVDIALLLGETKD